MVEPKKLSKAEVHYRKARGSDRCGNCAMYRPQLHRRALPSYCTLVEGDIDPYDTCDRYERDAA